LSHIGAIFFKSSLWMIKGGPAVKYLRSPAKLPSAKSTGRIAVSSSRSKQPSVHACIVSAVEYVLKQLTALPNTVSPRRGTMGTSLCFRANGG
jgi:hypothetical protein